MQREEIVKKFGRLLVPMLTAFEKDGKLDLPTSQKIADYILQENLCDSLIVAGTTGEFYTLSLEERIELFKAVREVAKGRVPLIAGTGAIYTKDAQYLTQAVEEMGYDMVMVVVPYYCRPTQEEIYHHFSHIARATSLPIMLYNIPLFAGENLQPETAERLSQIENIIAIKEEAALNPLQAMRFVLGCGDKVAVYSGDDTMILPIMSQGGVGGVSGGAQVIGKRIREMMNAFLAGNVEEAIRINQLIFPFFQALTMGGRRNPIPLLRVAFAFVSGIEIGPPRPPLLPPTEEEKGNLIEIVKKII